MASPIEEMKTVSSLSTEVFALSLICLCLFFDFKANDGLLEVPARQTEIQIELKRNLFQTNNCIGYYLLML